MKVLLLGSGGREHALAWKLSKSPLLKKLYAAPGSAAISAQADLVTVDILDPEAVTALARRLKVDLVVIGPEGPLAAGVADAARDAGIAVFGPGRAAARLESSKSFAKSFMDRHGIPTARWEAFEDPQGARSAAEAWRLPVVVKADGLAAGKGVHVCRDTNSALGAVTEFMERDALGEAGRRVVIEDCLQGEELSALAVLDGKSYVLLPFARDHKRLQEDDRGPNTGGMGAYAPVDVDRDTLADIRRLVFDRALAGLRADGLDYRGVLYAGLMLTIEGPRVLEFNCRFGDPEAQAILPLLKSDLLELARGCAAGKLPKAGLEVQPGSCVCVIMASEGYPYAPLTGRRVTGLVEIDDPDLVVFHSGTKRRLAEGWLTSGGRVLGISARGASLETARRRAYKHLVMIHFEGSQYRRDIGGAAVASA